MYYLLLVVYSNNELLLHCFQDDDDDDDGLSHRYNRSRHECVRRCEKRPIREAQVRPHVTQVKPPVVSLTPALCCDLFSCSLLTRSDSNCSTEVLHSARHDDLS